MKELPPIPTPPALRWREFRFRVVPPVVFLSCLGLCWHLWVRNVAPTSLVGEVEVVREQVRCTLPGTVAKLEVDQFSRVRAGDVVAQVITTDPKVLESTLAVIRAEVELLRVSADPALAKERNQLDHQRLRIEVLDQRAQLAVGRVSLQYAESELERISGLYRGSAVSNVASKAEYDLALRDRDALLREIEERSGRLGQIEQELAFLPSVNLTNALAATPDTLRAAIELQEAKLRLTEAQLQPITLTAPIDGTVSMVHRRRGESIVAGEPILTITSSQAERIIAYVLPPLSFEPEVGMTVEVRPRSFERRSGHGKILEVAEHMDLISPTLLLGASTRTGARSDPMMQLNNRPLEVGLPIAISAPPELGLRPGEPVDLTLVR